MIRILYLHAMGESRSQVVTDIAKMVGSHNIDGVRSNMSRSTVVTKGGITFVTHGFDERDGSHFYRGQRFDMMLVSERLEQYVRNKWSMQVGRELLGMLDEIRISVLRG